MNNLAPFVRTLARGPGRSRNLTHDEAADAMRLILSDGAAPEAVGALFMLMRYRGENAAEVAGFVTAMRERISGWSSVGALLDWPTYAAGRSRGLPYFVLSAALVAQAGVPVLMHGWTLRDILGLRSPVNTCLRALNPSKALASVQGVFHPSYRALQQDAAWTLGQSRLLCLKGGGGEFERHPAKDIAIFGLGQGIDGALNAPATVTKKRRLASQELNGMDDLHSLWTGTRQSPFEEAIIIGIARDLWATRLSHATAA